MKAKYLLIGGAGIIIVAIVILALTSNGNAETAKYEPNNNDITNAQIVKMKVVGSSYVFEPSSIESGKPVKIIADMDSVYGCARSVVIPAYGVRKYVSEKDNTILFTPTKTGMINIACSMNMYKGQLQVTGTDSVTSTVNTQAINTEINSDQASNQAISGPTCGASGGCGCGAKNI